MNPGNIRTKDFTLYIAPKLKWYQKILQKLHIKNYYKPLTVAVEDKTWKQK